MRKVTITFEYNEKMDGELTAQDIYNITEALIMYGNNIIITDTESDE